jgi:glycerophosphoryl diester phosphodiesterase
MRIVAHNARAGRAGAAAIRDAIATGADRIEVDVLALDGRLIVAHDRTEARRSATVVAFEDALAEIVAARRGLLADVKNAAAAAPLGAAIAAAGHGAASVASGDLALIQIVAERSGAARAWTLPAGRDAFVAAHPGPWGLATRAARGRVERAAAQAIADGRCDAVSVDRRFVSAGLVEAVHAVGGRVIVWTADRPAQIRRLAVLGADELVTNDPVAARNAVGE